MLVVVAIALLALFRALTINSKQIQVAPAPPLALDVAAAVAHLSRAVQFQTVSYDDSSPLGEHSAFIAWLDQTFPRVRATLSREVVAGHSLLYTWKGSDLRLDPILLMAHYDVVPVEPATQSKWHHDPFSGAIAGGLVWGRGTIDDKAGVLGIVEAAEILIAENFRPKRTVLFAFGHDEELGGFRGAREIARLLAQRGVKLDAVLDEGGAVTTGVTPGIAGPVALVGIAEKGFVSVELLSSGTGGHSSMPPPRTHVGIIAAAVDRLQRRPFPLTIRTATHESFRWLAPEMRPAYRMLFSNVWLFAPLVKAQSRGSNSLNAALRTTTAPTMVSGGVKDNVIPSSARAVVNFRILPGDSTDSVLRHVRQTVDNPAVAVRVLGTAFEPSSISDPSAPQFQTVARTIRQIFTDAVVAPYLVVGATDSRHFGRLTRNIYRFVPQRMNRADLDRVHGINERISIRDHLDGIRFYRLLILNTAG